MSVYDPLVTYAVFATGFLLLTQFVWVTTRSQTRQRIAGWSLDQRRRVWVAVAAVYFVVGVVTLTLHHETTSAIDRDIQKTRSSLDALSARLSSPECECLHVDAGKLVPADMQSMMDLAEHGIDDLHPIELGVTAGLLALVAGMLVYSVSVSGVEPLGGLLFRMTTLPLLFLLIILFVGDLAILQGFVYLHGELDADTDPRIQLITGKLPCAAFLVNDSGVVAEPACNSDYNTTECFFSDSIMMFDVIATGYPNRSLTLTNTINVSLPLDENQEPEWSPACIYNCVIGGVAGPSILELTCSVQSNAESIMSTDLDNYRAVTYTMIYGILVAAVAYVVTSDLMAVGENTKGGEPLLDPALL